MTNKKRTYNTRHVRIRCDQYDRLLKDSLELSQATGKVLGFSVYLQKLIDEHIERQEVEHASKR
jgi:hypothetical protein